MNRMFSFAAFFTARATLCVIRYDHLAMKLGPDVQEWNSIIGYGLRYLVLEFVNDVRLIKHHFTSLLYIRISH